MKQVRSSHIESSNLPLAVLALAWICWNPAVQARAAEQKAPPVRAGVENPLFALCMDTHDSKKRSLREQAELLKELGYAGAGHVWLDNVPERIETLERVGLKLYQIYVRVNIDPRQPPYDRRLESTLPLLKSRGTMLALLITGGKPSDVAGDGRAVKLVSEIADRAGAQGVQVALYPHAGHWLERVEDAIRVAKKVNRKNVGVMFNLCHWLKVGDERELKPLLKSAMPHLLAVTINGADHAADIQAGRGQMILPLDRGTFDLLAFLKILKELKYRGPLGLQCYGLPGDARDHLTRSMAAWRKLGRQLRRAEAAK